MEHRCEYTVTWRDFTEAMKGYRRVSTAGRVSYLLLVWILPVVLGLCSLFCILLVVRGVSDTSWSTWLMIAVFLGGTFGLPARYRMAIKRGFDLRNVLAKHRPMFLEFDQEKLKFVVPEGTEISYPWTAFTDYFENEHVTVLFIKAAVFHTIPKRAMNKDEWEQFYANIDGKLRKV